jgi:hypothetical protein
MSGKKIPFFLIPLLAITLPAAEPAGKVSKDELEAVAGAAALTPEQKTALAAIDARMTGLTALMTKVDDPDYKETINDQFEDLKKRRLALEKNFDQGLYEALMHSVIARYQVIALWLKPPALPPPPGYKPPPPPKRQPGAKKSSDTSPGTY